MINFLSLSKSIRRYLAKAKLINVDLSWAKSSWNKILSRFNIGDDTVFRYMVILKDTFLGEIKYFFLVACLIPFSLHVLLTELLVCWLLTIDS